MDAGVFTTSKQNYQRVMHARQVHAERWRQHAGRYRSDVNAQCKRGVVNASLRLAGTGTLPAAGVERGFGWLFAALAGASAAVAGVEVRLFGSARTLPPAGLLAASTLRLFADGAAFAAAWASFFTAGAALYRPHVCANVVTRAATTSAGLCCSRCTMLDSEGRRNMDAYRAKLASSPARRCLSCRLLRFRRRRLVTTGWQVDVFAAVLIR